MRAEHHYGAPALRMAHPGDCNHTGSVWRCCPGARTEGRNQGYTDRFRSEWCNWIGWIWTARIHVADATGLLLGRGFGRNGAATASQLRTHHQGEDVLQGHHLHEALHELLVRGAALRQSHTDTDHRIVKCPGHGGRHLQCPVDAQFGRQLLPGGDHRRYTPGGGISGGGQGGCPTAAHPKEQYPAPTPGAQ